MRCRTPGKEIYEQARDGKVIPWAQRLSQPAVDGQDVRLTIDADIQWFAQNTIGNLVHAMGAKSGTIVVMEAKTGKLRAVAPYPSFDPTDLAHTKASALGNKAFQEVYEPGSTAKVITARPIASPLSAMPGPDEEVTPRLPA